MSSQLLSFLVLSSLISSCRTQNQTPPECPTNKYSYAVVIKVANTNNQFCAGTLLGPRWVLTAAHCFREFNDPAMFEVVAKKISKVAEIIVYENFDPKSIENDVALLRLDESNEAESYGRIGDQNYTKNCQHVTAISWAKTREGSVNSKTCLDMTIIDNNVCNLLLGVRVQENICTSFGPGGSQPCPGDSGGPLICSDVVVGLISYGLTCDVLYAPSVFTNVGFYIDFVKTYTNKHNFSLKSDVNGIYHIELKNCCVERTRITLTVTLIILAINLISY